MMKHKAVLMFMATLLVSCVGLDRQLTMTDVDTLCIKKAQELYIKQENRMAVTKSDVTSHPVFFCQAPESILWEKSIVTRNQDGMVRIDVPVISRDVHMMMVPYDDGRRHYHSICYHYLTVYININSNERYIYNHYIIPYRTWESTYIDSPLTQEEYLERFVRMATSQIFNGTEVYSTLDGYIVEFNRYHEGRRYEHSTLHTVGQFDKNLSSNKRMARRLSSCYTRGVIFNNNDITKSQSDIDNECPQCGAKLESFGEWGAICLSCGEVYLYDNELDGSYCYDEFDPYMPWGSEGSQVQPDDNDNTGGGGTSTSGTSSQIYSVNSSSTTATSYIKSTISQLLELCMGSVAFENLAANQFQITFNYSANLRPLFYTHTSASPSKQIDFNISGDGHIQQIGLLEEFFHLIQFQCHPEYSIPNCGINMEIEAKLAGYLLVRQNGWDVTDISWYDQAHNLYNTTSDSLKRIYHQQLADTLLYSRRFEYFKFGMGYDPNNISFDVLESIAHDCNTIGVEGIN